MENGSTPFGVCKTFWKDFCANSNIHGVRYFAGRSLHWTERIWWMISFIVTIWLCASMIHDVWVDWDSKPMGLNSLETIDITKDPIPFPTVTICSPVKAMKQKLNISSKFKKMSDIEEVQFTALRHICRNLNRVTPLYKYEFVDESIYETIEDLAPKLDDVVRKCRWRQKEVNCSDIMSPVLTETGLCYAFNALNSDDIYTDEMHSNMMTVENNPNSYGWSLEGGYDKGSVHEYPFRALDSGPEYGLDLILSTNKEDQDQMCNGIYNSIIVMIKTPGELSNEDYYNIEPLKDISMILSPKLTYITEGVQNVEPSKRNCHKPGERPLRFFKNYCFTNCVQECIANFTKLDCGCVNFPSPRDENTKICGAANIECYNNMKFFSSKMYSLSLMRDTCNCKAACTYLVYKVRMESANLDKIYMKNANDTNRQLVRLSIFMRDKIMATDKWHERYTLIDFLYICGGLLGLFLGTSLLSIIEMIYYATLRTFWIIWRPRPPKIEPPVEQIIPNWNQESKYQVFKWLKNLFQLVRIFLREYCMNSNLHGLRYFYKEGYHWTERFLWLMLIGVSFGLCGSMIQNTWIQWQNDPTKIDNFFVRIATKSLPFPQVTLCSEIRTSKKKMNLELTLNSLSNLSSTQEKHLKALAHICPRLPDQLHFDNDHFSNDSIYETLQDIARSKKELSFYCKWRDQTTYCTQYFVPILTEDGLCFTFNALNSHEMYRNTMVSEMMLVKGNPNASMRWTANAGYKSTSDIFNYPYQINNVENLYFSVQSQKSDIGYKCNGFDQAFKLILTEPGDDLKMSRRYIRLLPSQFTIIEVLPELKSTRDEVRHFKPSQRKCFYSDERYLRYFKIYSQINCEEECLSNFTKNECGCVRFSQPRDKNTKICGSSKIKCMKAAQWKLATTSNEKEYQCNCLPACQAIIYNADVKRETFDMTTDDKETTIARVTFETISAKAKFGGEALTFVDFLAFCGGLLGIFLGFSLLSFIEIIFYATLGLYWCVRRLNMTKIENSNTVTPFVSGVEVTNVEVTNVIPTSESSN